MKSCYDDRPLTFAPGGMTPAVRMLLIATLAVFPVQYLVNARAGGAFNAIFGLSGAGLLGGSVWQPFTYPFLHGGLWHLLMNLLGLALCGPQVEEVLGRRRFLILYFGAGLAGGLGWILMSGGGAVCVGASGAVFGILGAFGAMFPDRSITLLLFFVLPLTMTARTMVLLLAGVSLLGSMTGGGTLAHAAHLFGGLAGYLYGRRIRLGAEVGGVGGWWRSIVEKVFARRRRFTVLPMRGQGLPDSAEVDRILDKIGSQGLASLTRRERAFLDRASRKAREEE